MTNSCPVCVGLGRILAFGFAGHPEGVLCPECAGLPIPPASCDDRSPVAAGERDRGDVEPDEEGEAA